MKLCMAQGRPRQTSRPTGQTQQQLLYPTETSGLCSICRTVCSELWIWSSGQVVVLQHNNPAYSGLPVKLYQVIRSINAGFSGQLSRLWTLDLPLTLQMSTRSYTTRFLYFFFFTYPITVSLYTNFFLFHDHFLTFVVLRFVPLRVIYM